MPFNPAMSRSIDVQVSSSGVGGVMNRLDGLVGTIGRLPGAVALAGAALATFAAVGLAKATKAAADFEDAMVEVQKVTDAETAGKLEGRIMELSRTLPVAQEELAGLAADAARFGIRGPENIEKFTEAVSKMAIATDLSTADAGQSLAKLATLTRIPTDEVENLGSAINELSNNYATSSQEIVDSMLRSAGALTQVGLNAQEVAGLSAALNEVSENSSRAGTRLRRLAQTLMDPGKVEKIAEAMGLTVDEFKRLRDNDPTGLIRDLAAQMVEGGEASERLASAVDSRVQMALTGLGQNLEGVNEGLEMSAKHYEENTSLQREFEAASSTLNNRVQILKNRLGELAIAIGMEVLPAAKGLVNVLIDAVDVVLDLGRELGRTGDAYLKWVDKVAEANKDAESSWDDMGGSVSAYRRQGEDAVENLQDTEMAIQTQMDGLKGVKDAWGQYFDRLEESKNASSTAQDAMSDVGGAAADAKDDILTAEEALKDFNTTMVEIRQGVASGFSLSDVRQFVSKNLKEVRSGQVDGPHGMQGANIHPFAGILERAQEALKGATSITDLPKGLATDIARIMSQQRKDEQEFRKEIFANLSGLGEQLYGPDGQLPGTNDIATSASTMKSAANTFDEAVRRGIGVHFEGEGPLTDAIAAIAREQAREVVISESRSAERLDGRPRGT